MSAWGQRVEWEGPAGLTLRPLRGLEWVKNSRLWSTLAEPYPVPGEADALVQLYLLRRE